MRGQVCIVRTVTAAVAAVVMALGMVLGMMAGHQPEAVSLRTAEHKLRRVDHKGREDGRGEGRGDGCS
jgi:hypothetical protein